MTKHVVGVTSVTECDRVLHKIQTISFFAHLGPTIHGCQTHVTRVARKLPGCYKATKGVTRVFLTIKDCLCLRMKAAVPDLNIAKSSYHRTGSVKCFRGVARMLQECNKCVTRMLREYYNDVTILPRTGSHRSS
jgi:hypothetical protein